MNFAGVAQLPEQRLSQPLGAGENPAPRSTFRGPWALTDAEARQRDLAIARAMLNDVARFFVPGMSSDHVRMQLASRGWSARELRWFDQAVEKRHGSL